MEMLTKHPKVSSFFQNQGSNLLYKGNSVNTIIIIKGSNLLSRQYKL